MKTIRHDKLEPRLQAALAGLSKVFPKGMSLGQNGVSVTQGQLLKQLEDLHSHFLKVHNDKQGYHASVVARRKVEPRAREFLVQLRAALLGFYGRNDKVLAEFGMTSGSLPPVTKKKK